MEKNFSLKKAPRKIFRVLHPIRTSPFVVPTTIRFSCTKRPYRGQSTPGSSQLFSSGENRTTEASEAVFDLTQGDEGMETPLPNDSSIASVSPPVGGHLHFFRRDWQTNKCSSNVLNIITNGYILPFISKPKLAELP